MLGPLIFFVLIWAVVARMAAQRRACPTKTNSCIAYILPPFVFISVIAFISRANANWAAVAYPGDRVLVDRDRCSSTARRPRLLARAIAAQHRSSAWRASRSRRSIPSSPTASRACARARAWEETAREIALRAAPQPGEPPFTAVMVDDRATYFELSYYWREARRAGAPLPPVRMWLLHGDARNSAEVHRPDAPRRRRRACSSCT